MPSTEASFHRIQRFEGLPQLLPALRPNALHVIQHRDEIALATQLAVEGNRKAMRLVTNALNKVQRRTVTVE